MINAKEELLEVLQRSGKSIEDIEFAGLRYDCNLEEIDLGCVTENPNFLLKSLDFLYDEDYGTQHIYGYILFRDGSWLERREYDGAEWWRFMIPPTKESIKNYINTLYI